MKRIIPGSSLNPFCRFSSAYSPVTRQRKGTLSR
ncbi:rho operon leader peptide [Klebsiella pneumoniae]|nr:rho operon leader peptide [Klebsiella pneumoniae]